MKRFHYIATNEQQKKKKGTLLASSKEEAIRRLRDEKKIILNIREENGSPNAWFGGPSLSFEEKLMMTKHLGTMVEAGISLTEAFQTFAEQEKRKNNKRMFENILKMITSGQTLAASMKTYPKIFSDIYVSMIAVGEESGSLSEALHHLDIQLEKEFELRKKVLSAMIYPGVIVSITLLLTLGIVLFIIPKITKIFDALGGQLPLPTRILIGTSTFMIDHPFTSLLLAGGFIAFCMSVLKWRVLRPLWHGLVLHLPILGKIFVNINLARFSRNMNALLQAGVPITRAIDITSRMFTNHFYKSTVEEARTKVEQGSKLFETLKDNEKLFPPMLVKMIQVGEKTGKLEKAMEHLAVLYEREVDNQTRNLSILLEPILLVFMGAMVGSVAISIILPIYQIPNLISR